MEILKDEEDDRVKEEKEGEGDGGGKWCYLAEKKKRDGAILVKTEDFFLIFFSPLFLLFNTKKWMKT